MNLKVYRLAFQHKSKHKESNERLEFLGDTILDSVVSDVLYRYFPSKDEGDLSKIRSKIVSREQLNSIGRKLDLLLLLDYRKTNANQLKGNMLGNTLEALVGAVYLDGGYEQASYFVRKKLLKQYIDWKEINSKIVDFKSLLYDYVQKNNIILTFEVEKEYRKDHSPYFDIKVLFDGREQAKGSGKNKKSAEQDGSKNVLQSLGLLEKEN